MIVKEVGTSIAGIDKFEVGEVESAAALAAVVRNKARSRRGRALRCIFSFTVVNVG